ncbi:Uncharacterised protein [Vibrio cholerae]|nr:Uncharacterised protein [Vibrio cholerae]
MIFSTCAFSSSSLVRWSSSSCRRSAGRQVIACPPSNTRACSSAFTLAGVAPYSPLRTPAVSLVMLL